MNKNPRLFTDDERKKSISTRKRREFEASRRKNQYAKALRLKKGLMVKDVAEYLGITYQSLGNKEAGRCPWQWSEIKKLIELYGINSIEELKKIF